MKMIRIASRLAVLVMIALYLFSFIAARVQADSAASGGSGPIDGPAMARVGQVGCAADGDEADPSDPPRATTGDAKTQRTLIENLITLGMLVLLQAVLGFDNLLYISIESGHAPPEKQHAVRVWGIGLAIVFRILLLGVLVKLKDWFETVDVVQFNWSWAIGHFNVHSLIVLAGGAFIIYTAMKEIWHMIQLEDHPQAAGGDSGRSVTMIIFWIVLMNIIFSFDSILSAMALSDVFWVMATAIVLSGLAMIWLADRVAEFLAKNRTYEVLGLFVLFIVGVMLVSEGGHLAGLNLFGNPVEPMTKTTFYFVLTVLILTDVVQSRYQQKLARQQMADEAALRT